MASVQPTRAVFPDGDSSSRIARLRIGFAAALVLFLISLLLPAYDRETGWSCAKAVLGVLVDFDTRKFWQWLYYSAFNVTNLLLLVLPVLAFTKLSARFASAMRWVVAVSFLHTASWMFLQLFDNKIGEINIGYYIWLLAVGILLASCIARVRCMKKAATAEAIPPPDKSTEHGRN